MSFDIKFTKARLPECLLARETSQAIQHVFAKPSLVNFLSKDPKIVSEYDQELPQSQTADNPVAPRGRAAQPSRDTRKTN